jgi:hypothetical protein
MSKLVTQGILATKRELCTKHCPKKGNWLNPARISAKRKEESIPDKEKHTDRSSNTSINQLQQRRGKSGILVKKMRRIQQIQPKACTTGGKLMN